jgi:hypothetical protein
VFRVKWLHNHGLTSLRRWPMDGLLWIAAVSCLSIWPLKYSNVAAFAATISEPKLAKSMPVTSATKECILALRQGLSSEISVSCMNHTIRRHTVSYELKSVLIRTVLIVEKKH